MILRSFKQGSKKLVKEARSIAKALSGNAFGVNLVLHGSYNGKAKSFVKKASIGSAAITAPLGVVQMFWVAFSKLLGMLMQDFPSNNQARYVTDLDPVVLRIQESTREAHRIAESARNAGAVTDVLGILIVLFAVFISTFVFSSVISWLLLTLEKLAGVLGILGAIKDAQGKKTIITTAETRNEVTNKENTHVHLKDEADGFEMHGPSFMQTSKRALMAALCILGVIFAIVMYLVACHRHFPRLHSANVPVVSHVLRLLKMCFTYVSSPSSLSYGLLSSVSQALTDVSVGALFMIRLFLFHPKAVANTILYLLGMLGVLIASQALRELARGVHFVEEAACIIYDTYSVMLQNLFLLVYLFVSVVVLRILMAYSGSLDAWIRGGIARLISLLAEMQVEEITVK